jgi:hypothetical protein
LLIVAALFHDGGKIGHPGKLYYLPNDNKWEIEKRGIAYKVNLDIVTMNPAVQSLHLVSGFIPPTEQRCHRHDAAVSYECDLKF